MSSARSRKCEPGPNEDATAALPADEDGGLGYGLTLHFGQSSPLRMLPHLDLGVLWHERGDGDEGIELSLGVDLLRLLR